MIKLNKKISAYIPLKEHSSRIPGKNFKLINNYPLFYWILNTLEQIERISEIVINTDSKKLILMLKSYDFQKIKTYWREDKLCGDDVSVNKIIDSDIEKLENEIVLQTHVTNPLVSISTLFTAINAFYEMDSKYDSLFSVNKYQKRFFDSKLTPLNHDPKVLIKTQDLEPLYVENSCIYLFSKKSFRDTKSRVGNNPFLFVMDEYEALDIDWPQDFSIVEKILSLNKK